MAGSERAHHSRFRRWAKTDVAEWTPTRGLQRPSVRGLSGHVGRRAVGARETEALSILLTCHSPIFRVER